MTFKELLKSNDITPARLSRRINLNRYTVYNWVNGKNMPTVITVSKIAEELDVDILLVIDCLKNTFNAKKGV